MAVDYVAMNDTAYQLAAQIPRIRLLAGEEIASLLQKGVGFMHERAAHDARVREAQDAQLQVAQEEAGRFRRAYDQTMRERNDLRGRLDTATARLKHTQDELMSLQADHAKLQRDAQLAKANERPVRRRSKLSAQT